MREFKLRRSDIAKKGGNKSPISRAIDDLFFKRDWIEESFDIKADDITALLTIRKGVKYGLEHCPRILPREKTIGTSAQPSRRIEWKFETPRR